MLMSIPTSSGFDELSYSSSPIVVAALHLWTVKYWLLCIRCALLTDFVWLDLDDYAGYSNDNIEQ